MLGIGFGEFLIVAIVLLLAVGPKSMPLFMRSMGRGIRQVRQAARELRSQVGIDELLQEELVPPGPLPGHWSGRAEVTDADRAAEYPAEGVDLAHARHAPTAPSRET